MLLSYFLVMNMPHFEAHLARPRNKGSTHDKADKKITQWKDTVLLICLDQLFIRCYRTAQRAQNNSLVDAM